MPSSIRFTKAPKQSVRCPWSGQQVVFSENDDINDPDEVLYWRGVGLGKYKADPKKLEETFGIVEKKKGSKRGRISK